MLDEMSGWKKRVTDLESQLAKERTRDTGEIASPSGMRKKVMDKGTLANLRRYVQTVLFEKLKFVNDETLEQHPQILKVIWERIAISDEGEQIEYKEDVIKELKRDFSHRRSYCRKLIMTKYKSEQLLCVMKSWEYCLIAD